MRTVLLATLLLISGVRVAAAQPVTTQVDPAQSVIQYSGTSFIDNWTGVSRQASGTLVLDFGSPGQGRIEVAAPVESFDSGNSNRDSNMLDAVEVESYPAVRFVSTSIQPVQDGVWQVKGNLTFHGETHPVELPVRVGMSPTLFEAQGAFDVSLTEFGIRRPKLMLKPIDDVIKVEFTIRAPLVSAE